MKKNKILISLFLLLLSLSAIAQLVVFESNNPVKAQEMNQNFNYLKFIFQNKNVTIPFSTYYSGEVIESQKIETDFDLVRNLGITVPALASQRIFAHELNASFSAIEFEALIYNDTPVANSGAATILEDESLVGVLNFVNVVGPTNVQIVNNVSHGSLILNSLTGQFTYFPNLNYNGSDSFSYKVSDGTLESPIRTFNITIESVNDAPIITLGSLTTRRGVTGSSSMTASDVEGNSITYSTQSLPTKGVLNFNSNGSFSFVPNLGAFGPDSFSVVASDGVNSSTPFVVNITINNIGIDGDLTITSGQTVTLAAGSQRQYTNLTITSGGTLQITGTSATTTKIEVFGTMSVNGTIRAITNSNTATNSTLTFNGETFAHSRAQQVAGSGAGSPTANGSHGNPLVIFANTLIGTGVINAAGISSADGAAGAYSRTCGSGRYLYQLTISGCNGKYTCLQTGYGPNITCGNTGSCSTSCSNFISKIEQIKELLQNLNPINSAYAGGGGFCFPPSCSQTTPTGTYGTRQGTGAGGNGGNIWIRTVNAYGGTISLNSSGVVSGVLSTLGTGGTRGATGLSGTSSVTTTPAF
jgi:hypothetical protein